LSYFTKNIEGKNTNYLVEISTRRAPLLLDIADHPEELPYVPVKELVVVVDYVLQVFHPLPHCFHGLKALVDGREEIRYSMLACRTTHGVLSKRVIVTGVAVVVAVVVGITTAIGTFGSWFLRNILPIIEVVIIAPDGCLGTRAAVVGEVTSSIVLWLKRHLLVVLFLLPLKTLRSPDESCDLLFLDVMTTCDWFSRDTASATDAGSPLHLHLGLELTPPHLLRLQGLLES
jgi:hypothetical protein